MPELSLDLDNVETTNSSSGHDFPPAFNRKRCLENGHSIKKRPQRIRASDLLMLSATVYAFPLTRSYAVLSDFVEHSFDGDINFFRGLVATGRDLFAELGDFLSPDTVVGLQGLSFGGNLQLVDRNRVL